MGYYLDLYFRDETRRHKPEELVTMFCEHGCEKSVLYKEKPEWAEVYHRNEEYSASMLIHFIDKDKDTESTYFADVRLSWATTYDGFINTIRSLLVLGDIFDFYIYDACLKTEISLENLDSVAEQVTGISKKMVGVLGKCVPHK